MHPQTVFTKTSKGVLEVKKRTIRLRRDLSLLLAVDGRSPDSVLLKKIGMDESSLVQALNRLVANGYIKIFYEPLEAGESLPVSSDIDLDFTRPVRPNRY